MDTCGPTDKLSYKNPYMSFTKEVYRDPHHWNFAVVLLENVGQNLGELLNDGQQ